MCEFFRWCDGLHGASKSTAPAPRLASHAQKLGDRAGTAVDALEEPSREDTRHKWSAPRGQEIHRKLM